MPEPRKVFRIERTAAMCAKMPTEGHQGDQAALRHAEIMRELSALRALLAVAPSRSQLGDAAHRPGTERLAAELNLIHGVLQGTWRQQAGRDGSEAQLWTRIAHELDAVLKGSDEATQKILTATEDIDQAAGNLSAALRGEFEQGLAQDIQDRVTQIFEACNFQDLISQRVAKVMTTLNHIEDQISRALRELSPPDTKPSVHGPRLPGDRGHASQSDIDAMFGGTAQTA